MSNTAILFEHDDGRHAAAWGEASPDFTHDDPAWHRVGPVDVSALSTNAGEAAPVAFEWPKLDKPARAGGGVFRAGVSSRFVVEAAQRLYAASEVDRNRTPEEMQDDERKRRSLWDMIHGSPHPPAVHGQSASTEVYLVLRNSGGLSKRETVLGVFGTKAAADAEMERAVEVYHEEFPGYRRYGDAPLRSWSVRRHEVLATPTAAIPAAPSEAALQEAHRLGFLRAAGWMQRDDLFDDVASPAYRKDRDHDLAALAQPAPAYHDSTAELHVGNSSFESWFQAHPKACNGDKQLARDAYAAGMGDPLVCAKAPPVQQEADAAPATDGPPLKGLAHFHYRLVAASGYEQEGVYNNISADGFGRVIATLETARRTNAELAAPAQAGEVSR